MQEFRRRQLEEFTGIWELQSFGDVAKSKRLRRGISIRALALETDLSPTTIQHVEAGSDPKVSTVLAMGKALDILLTVDANVGPDYDYD